jgi:hypothetical protein
MQGIYPGPEVACHAMVHIIDQGISRKKKKVKLIQAEA